MTFKKAYAIAMEKSETFRKFDERVKEAEKTGTDSGCMIFTPAVGETFYYGFDGVDMHKGKHTSRRAAVMTDRAEVLIIL